MQSVADIQSNRAVYYECYCVNAIRDAVGAQGDIVGDNFATGEKQGAAFVNSKPWCI